MSRVACRSVWLALSLALPASTEARAQSAGPTLELGERVRVSARDYRPYVEYIFEGRSADSLQFRHVGTTLTHWKHERDVRRLGRFVRPRSRGMGAVRGLRWAVVGVALGAAIGAVQKDCTGCLESPTKGERMRTAATELGIVSATMGATIGAIAPGDVWQRIDPRNRAAFAPRRGFRRGWGQQTAPPAIVLSGGASPSIR